MLEAISAIQELNVTKFFHCLKKASYMESCCISHYLPSIRRAGFEQLSRAVTKSKDYKVSLSFLKNIFLFNDYEELIFYIQCYGLDVSYLFNEDNDDNYLEEIKLENSFIEDWTIYDRIADFHQMGIKKNKIIDEKKNKALFDSKKAEMDEVNYFNNNDVSRQFLVKGKWKNNENLIFDDNKVMEVNENIYDAKKIEKFEGKNLEKKDSKILTLNNNHPTNLHNNQFINQNPILSEEVSFQGKKDSLFKELRDEQPMSPIFFNNNNNFGQIKFKNIPTIFPQVNPQSLKLEKRESSKEYIEIPKPIILERKEPVQKIKKGSKLDISTHRMLMKKIRKILQKKKEVEKIKRYISAKTQPKDKIIEENNNLIFSENANKHFLDLLSSFILSNQEVYQSTFKISILPIEKTRKTKIISSCLLNILSGNNVRSLRKFVFKKRITSEESIIHRKLEYSCRIIDKLEKGKLKGSKLIIFIMSFNEDRNIAVVKKILKLLKEKIKSVNFLFIYENENMMDVEKVKKNLGKILSRERNSFVFNFKHFNIPKVINENHIDVYAQLESVSLASKLLVFAQDVAQHIENETKSKVYPFQQIFLDIYYLINNFTDVEVDRSLKKQNWKAYFYNKNLINWCLTQFLESFKRQSEHKYSEMTEFYDKKGK